MLKKHSFFVFLTKIFIFCNIYINCCYNLIFLNCNILQKLFNFDGFVIFWNNNFDFWI